jgi:hypothetical protein
MPLVSLLNFLTLAACTALVWYDLLINLGDEVKISLRPAIVSTEMDRQVDLIWKCVTLSPQTAFYNAAVAHRGLFPKFST